MGSTGTSAAFIGNIPTDSFSQFFSSSIDGGTSLNTSYASSTPPAYIQWYQTPVLSDGKHTVQLSHLDGTAVDMVIVTVGPNTPLAGKKVFVDNNDSSIQYSGSWAESKSGFDAGTLPDGLPIGNSTQQSTTPGDTMTFRFSGAFMQSLYRRFGSLHFIQERQFLSTEYSHGQISVSYLRHTRWTAIRIPCPTPLPPPLPNISAQTATQRTSCFTKRTI